MNYSEVQTVFFQMELDNQLFAMEINGVYIWKLIRIYVFNQIVQTIFKSGFTHPNTSTTLTALFEDKWKEIKTYYKYNAFRIKSNAEIVVVRHRRRIKVDNEYIEVNTAYLSKIIEELSNNKVTYVETQLAFENRNVENNSLFLMSSPVKRWGLRFFVKKSHINIMIDKCAALINSYVKKAFNLKIDVTELILKNYIWYITGYKTYYKFFKQKKTKKVYLVCSYGKESLIQAARDLNIPTVEIMHGVITKFHMGYSFPKGIEIPYFPDQIFVYGEYWKKAVPFPLSSNDIIVIGNPYFEIQTKKYKNYIKKPNTILVVSSGSYGKALSELIFKFHLAHPEYHIIYKLHPSEFKVWKYIYNNINSAVTEENFDVIEDSVNIYELLASSEYVLGVNSTVLFEALGFSSCLILFNYPGVEYMNDLINMYHIPVVNDENELFAVLKSDRPKIINRNIFYKEI